MAIVLPVVLIIVFGALSIGQLTYVRKSTVAAVNEGIRLASQRSASADDVETRVTQILAARRIDAPIITLTPPNLGSLVPGSLVTLHVEAPYRGLGVPTLGLTMPASVAVEGAVLRE